jgi:hypothetical protein
MLLTKPLCSELNVCATEQVLDALERQIAESREKEARERERSVAEEAVRQFGEAVVKSDFQLARALLEKAGAHYKSAQLDMTQVLLS